MSARAGIVVTGTEVLEGRVRDRNGPWLAERLRELGVDLAYVTIVGDRPQDMGQALRFMAEQGVDLVLTSGGLGPTADDLTAEIVAGFHGRAMALDEALADRIEAIVSPLLKRRPNLDPEAIRVGTRKQAMVPEGATVLEPVGTAPGLVVPPSVPGSGPTVVVLPGPPRELRPMWSAAIQTDALREAIAGATVYEQRTLRLFGIPESEIAETLRQAEREGIELGKLEVTTCLKRGEIEVVTRYEPDAAGAYEEFERLVGERHADTLFSTDGDTVDEQVAGMLREQSWSIAVAESCTGGELTARLTGPAGASEYVKGGIVVYANEAKVVLAGVDRELIEEHGAVSEQVARALAEGARGRMDADVGVGVTGVAGPGGGTERKPVGSVWLSVAGPEGTSVTRSVNLPGGRADVRDRACTVSLHMVRRLLLGEVDG
ncbi:MAG TPA: competence/damage-inducible protein A [Solirubrobacteraceae bacterium]|jgi:nicotinamide-nucleotide amidase|nr:competence/damage-inducible protein A [Solirubrobacteraceae bacterium]